MLKHRMCVCDELGDTGLSGVLISGGNPDSGGWLPSLSIS